MLILTRGKDESIVIDGKIVVTVLDIDRGRIRLGFEAPTEVQIARREVRDRQRRKERQQPEQDSPA